MSDKLAVGQDASNVLSYMKMMFDEAKANGIKLRREDFMRFGANVELFGKHGRIGGLGRILRRAGGRAVGNFADGVHQKLRRHAGKALHQIGRGVRLQNRCFADLDDVALVHSGRQIHGGHTRLLQSL